MLDALALMPMTGRGPSQVVGAGSQRRLAPEPGAAARRDAPREVAAHDAGSTSWKPESEIDLSDGTRGTELTTEPESVKSNETFMVS